MSTFKDPHYFPTLYQDSVADPDLDPSPPVRIRINIPDLDSNKFLKKIRSEYDLQIFVVGTE